MHKKVRWEMHDESALIRFTWPRRSRLRSCVSAAILTDSRLMTLIKWIPVKSHESSSSRALTDSVAVVFDSHVAAGTSQERSAASLAACTHSRESRAVTLWTLFALHALSSTNHPRMPKSSVVTPES